MEIIPLDSKSGQTRQRKEFRMAKVVCSQCGTTGDSKCPACRNVFPDRQDLAEIEFRVDGHPVYDEDEDVVRMTVKGYINDDQEEELGRNKAIILALHRSIKHLSELSVEDLTVLLCNHRFEFAEGQHSDIGCGH